MDTNTPKNSSADINIIESLWKKRFGIDATALDRALLLVQTPCDWVDSDGGKKFYKYAPEFTLEKISAGDCRNGYEFYLFNQCDSHPRWYDINIYYHQTLLYSLGGAALDGGRCFTSTPQTDGISLYKESYHHWDISYKYFVKGSIEHIIHLFYITDNMDEELTARQRFMECILVFESEYERMKFNDFVIANFKKYNVDEFTNRLPYFPDLEGYNMDTFTVEVTCQSGVRITLRTPWTRQNLRFCVHNFLNTHFCSWWYHNIGYGCLEMNIYNLNYCSKC